MKLFSPFLLVFTNFKKIFLSIFLLVFFLILYKIYFKHVGSFGCFDDCFNYLGGYFILNGRQLYSQVFFNHQPLAAYISAFIQFVIAPKTVYQLIYAHRLATFLLAFIANCLLAYRFGAKVLLFSLFFELSKYYFFGDRFLAEGIIVYPIIYVTGLVMLRLLDEKVYPFEYLLASFFTWFIIFMREPYIPLGLVLYIFLLGRKRYGISHVISLILFISLVGLTILSLPFNEYFFNVVTVNKTVEVQPFQFSLLALAKIFGYPIFTLLFGKLNLVRTLLVGLSVTYLLCSISLLIEKKYLLVLISILTLGFANVRYTIPGTTFYESFHMVVWFALIIFFSAFFIFSLLKSTRFKTVGGISLIIFFLPLLYFIVSKSSFIYESVNANLEFTTNYGGDYASGEVIKILSKPGETLFLDGGDDLIYWQAKLLSGYKYSWYTSVMPYFSKYKNARNAMFAQNAPDFYYGTCAKPPFSKNLLPKNLKKDYINVTFAGNPSCIHIKSSILARITQKQKNDIKMLGYGLP